MKKLIAISALSLATFGMTACHHTAQAQIKPTATALATTNTSYKNERHMTIDGVSFPVSETSARILVGADGQPLLVDDIFDGKADRLSYHGDEPCVIGGGGRTHPKRW